jgi:Rps23 Pro-64 3,4-dihydroxylase Tpa1-like proline 4-hydroxylase
MNGLAAALNALERHGYAVTDGLIDRALAESLRDEARALEARGDFRPARVGDRHARARVEAAGRPNQMTGRASTASRASILACGPRTRVPDVPPIASPIGESTRTDHIHWLDAAASDVQRAWLAEMESLRLAINERLTLGLFDLECHYACYAPGGYYRPHLDRFRRDSRRTLSIVMYLNADWTADDGGALRLYLGDLPAGRYCDVLPRLGTAALFLSDRYWHEVRPARRPRYAVTGWFRTRG